MCKRIIVRIIKLGLKCSIISCFSSFPQRMPGVLPEPLRIGVYEAYEKSSYGQFMQRVVALQEGTMSLEVVDRDVFMILGYDQGPNNNVARSATTESLRPDLYRMFVEWSTDQPRADIHVPAGLPKNVSADVFHEPDLHKVAFRELAFHQKILEELAYKVHRMETNFSSGNVVQGMNKNDHLRINTKIPPILENDATDTLQVTEEKPIALPPHMDHRPGPIPESLRKGVHEAYDKYSYDSFVQIVIALQHDTISLVVADKLVFDILGYDQGQNYNVVRSATTKSRRPDLYRKFVEWVSGVVSVVETKKQKTAPLSFGKIDIPTAVAETPCIGSATTKMLLSDLIALEAAVAMSPMMQAAMRTGAGPSTIPFPFDAVRLQWQAELLKRVSTDAKM